MRWPWVQPPRGELSAGEENRKQDQTQTGLRVRANRKGTAQGRDGHRREGQRSASVACVTLATLVQFIRNRARWIEGLCWKCGYDLTGNVSGVCPECGLRIERP